jgi:hypothetical protein
VITIEKIINPPTRVKQSGVDPAGQLIDSPTHNDRPEKGAPGVQETEPPGVQAAQSHREGDDAPQHIQEPE